MKKIQNIIFVGMAAGIAPLMHLGMHATFDLPKLALLAWGGGLLLILWTISQKEKLTIKQTPLDFPLLGLGIVLLASTFFSWDRPTSLFGFYRIYTFGLLPLGFTALLYWLVVQCSPARQKIINAVLISCTAIAFYGILQYFGIEIFSRMPQASKLRVWSSLGNPLYLGAATAMAIPLALDQWLLKKRAWLAGAFAICLGAMVLTLSRSAWLGCMGGISVVLLSRLHRRERKFGAMALLMLLAVLLALPQSRARFLSIFDPKESSNLARVEGWKGALRLAAQHPVIGTGPDTFGVAFRGVKSKAYVLATGHAMTQQHAHNDFLQWLTTTGFIGLGGYLWLVSVFLFYGWRISSESRTTNHESLGIYAACVALLIQNQFNFSSITTLTWAALLSGLLFSDFPKRFVLPRWSKGFAAVSSLAYAAAVGILMVRFIAADLSFQHGLGWLPNQQYGQAIMDLEKAVRLNPWVPDYRVSLINTYKALAQTRTDPGDRLQDLEKSRAVMEEALRLHPHNVDVHNNLAVALMWLTQLAGQDHFQEAVALFEKSVNLDPTFSETWAHIARMHHVAGQDQQARPYWQKVLELDPNNMLARDVLGLNDTKQK